MITTVNSLASTSVVEPSFTWSPSGTFSTPVGGLVVPKAAINTLLTFTAVATVTAPGRILTVIEYDWDFGDGTVSFGPSATHTYTIANLQAACTLRVTDSLGRYWYSRHQLYLS